MSEYPDLEAVRMALNACPTHHLEIYKATDLTPPWQQAFACGRTAEPSYVKIVALVEYLKREHIMLLSQCERAVRLGEE